MKNACVIGAGVAGIITARHLLDNFNVTILEASSNIGGVWVYKKETGSTPMYRNLKTNLPKQVVRFQELDHPVDATTFLTHKEVMAYLSHYCSKFGIWDKISFNDRVLHVKPDMNNYNEDNINSVKWIVSTDKGCKTYDAVAVCTGHFNIPYIPEEYDTSQFKGSVIHSCSYDNPLDFKDQTVFIVGFANSALDIALDIRRHGAKIAMYKRNTDRINSMPLDVVVVTDTSVKSFLEDSVVFNNNTEYKVDSIIFCTGYKSDLSFLDPLCKISQYWPKNVAYPCYRLCLNAYYPSMALIDRAYIILPFLLTEYQAQYFAAVLLGKAKLPTLSERLEASCDYSDLNKIKFPCDRFYVLGESQFDYYKKILTDCDSVPDNLSQFYDLYIALRRVRDQDAENYRSLYDDAIRQ